MTGRRHALKTLIYGSVGCGVASLFGCGDGKIANSQAATQNTTVPPIVGPPVVTASFDVVVYGGTPGGVMAAVAAAREGLKVALVEPQNQIGGMFANGLATTDCLELSKMGGLARQYLQDISNLYKNGPGGPARVFEPRIAERLLIQYLEMFKVELYSGDPLKSVYKSGSQIDSITLNNISIGADRWIDASYEGDLMAGARVSYSIGREAANTFGETFGGWGQGQVFANISPYQPDGTLLADIPKSGPSKVGSADQKIMAYTFRTCLTDDIRNMRPLPRPRNYDASRFEALARLIKENKFSDLSQLVYIQRTIGHKANIVSAFQQNPLSTDYVGGSWNYPEASAEERLLIQADHYNYVAGWLYFVANENVVPSSIRLQMSKFGLALDEFTDNDNWPSQMYVREARRLSGKYVMSQKDIMSQRSKSDVICLGNWYIDCHYCQVFLNGDSSQIVGFDGFINKGGPGYHIPFRSILPDESEASNLLVVCCPSSSHVAFSSMRVEPTYMALGEAAGVAAAISLRKQTTLSALNASDLQDRLLTLGAVLS